MLTGRFDREIEIPVPKASQRAAILQYCTCQVRLARDVNLAKIADVAVGYVGADLAALVREAALCSERRVDADTPVVATYVALMFSVSFYVIL